MRIHTTHGFIARILFVLSVACAFGALQTWSVWDDYKSEVREGNTQTCDDVVCNCHENNCGIDCGCWVCYEDEAYVEYADEFTALFNSYETKWAKNGRLMIRQGSTGSFKFAKKG